MMIHKIFHMNQSIEETERRLKNVPNYRHHLEGVDSVRFNGKLSRWKLQLPLGFKADLTLEQLDGGDSETVLFRSVGGDVNITGAIAFHAVKPNLTEVELMVDYNSTSLAFNALDRMLSIADHFVVNQLRRVRAHFEGIAAPAPSSMHYFQHSVAATA